MNDKFDELAKALAQPIARRAALKRFGVGLAAFALAALGLTNNAHAAKGGNGLPGFNQPCTLRKGCQPGLVCCPRFRGSTSGFCVKPTSCGGA